MTVPEIVGKTAQEIFSKIVPRTRKVGGVPLSADIPVTLTGDTAITVTNTGTASAIGYSIAHKDSGAIAGSKGDTTNQTPGFGGTFKVLSATVDAKGHVTALNDHTTRIPDAEATQSTKGLMSALDKTKLDTLVDDTLSTTGKAADAKATGDSLSLLRELINGIDAPIYRTASGNPATFSDADAANVKDLRVTLTPTQAGSGDPSPDNVRPISGVSSVSVTRAGKNLWGGDKIKADANKLVPIRAAIGDTAVTYNAAGAYDQITDIPFRPNTPYTFILAYSTDGPVLINLKVMFTDGSQYRIPRAGGLAEGVAVYTTPSNKTVGYLALDFHATRVTLDVTRTGIFEGAVTAEGFEPYQGQTVTAQLTDGANSLTVYGGTLDVTTGELTVTHKLTDLESGVWDYNASNHYVWSASFSDIGAKPSVPIGDPYLSSHFQYHENFVESGLQLYVNTIFMSTSARTVQITNVDEIGVDSAEAFQNWLAAQRVAGTPVQVFAQLATPLTYQLTPQQLAALSGYNSVTTDAGTLEVQYRADPSITLGGG